MSTIASFTTNNIRQWNKAYAEAINPDSDQIKSFPVIMTPPYSPYSQVYSSKSYTPYSHLYPSKSYTPYIGINPLTSNVVSSGFYKDLNKDKSVQKNLTKYYFYKILDKWIYKELMPLLAFVDISSDKPKLIKSLSQYDVEKLSSNSSEQVEKKINYLEKVLITKDMVKYVLKKICSENGVNWYDLDKNEKKIKIVFYNYLLDKLKDSIKKYGDKE